MTVKKTFCKRVERDQSHPLPGGSARREQSHPLLQLVDEYSEALDVVAVAFGDIRKIEAH
jgi:hypothetical protein